MINLCEMHAGCMDLPRVLTTSSSSWMKTVKSHQALVAAAVKVEEDPREERYKSFSFLFIRQSLMRFNNVFVHCFFRRRGIDMEGYNHRLIMLLLHCRFAL